jgi:transcriptional regulator with XRE-family HTH domain
MATQGTEWAQGLHQRIAKAIQDARAGGVSAQQLADETKRLGYPISRSQIANYESGRKQGLDVAELIVIAAALRTPPVTLLFGGHPDEIVEMLPNDKQPTVKALAWFMGDRELAWGGPELEPDEARDRANNAVADADLPAFALLNLYRERAAKYREIAIARMALKLVKKDSEFERALEYIGVLAGSIETLNILIDAAVAENGGEAK